MKNVRPLETCYLGLGSNLGNRSAFLKAARREIQALPHVEITGQSPLYETEPVGCEEQHWFLNQVISLRTDQSPMALLDACLKIEKRHGRVRAYPLASRTLDIDILIYGNRVIRESVLSIPHPRLAERRFVLFPLSALCPEWRHPESGKTVVQMLRELKTTHQVIPYSPKTRKEIPIKGEPLWI